MKIVIYLIFIINLIEAKALTPKEWLNVRTVIHLHSNISPEGSYEIESLIQQAKNYNIDLIIPTDKFVTEFEYGLVPFQGIIKKRISKTSILKYGIEKYFQDWNEFSKKYNISVIYGAEITPHYFWQGNFLKKNLTIFNSNKHMLVFGLTSQSFKNLPVVGNNFKFKWSRFIFGILFLILGSILIKIKLYKTVKFGYFIYKRRKKSLRNFGILLSLIGMLTVIDSFFYNEFSIYKDCGEEPYQKVIDYVKKNSGFVFWAHPDSPTYETRKIGNINLFTPAYGRSLISTKNYDGFAIIYEGLHRTGIPGGIWDGLLQDYVFHKRKGYCWVIGESDFRGISSDEPLGSVQTVILTKTKSMKDILNSISQGKMYVLRRPENYFLILNDFSITSNNKNAIIGESIVSDGNIKINLNVEFSNKQNKNLQIKIIKSGEIFFDKSLSTPVNLKIKDKIVQSTYYRVMIEEKTNSLIITNPIFVNFKV